MNPEIARLKELESALNAVSSQFSVIAHLLDSMAEMEGKEVLHDVAIAANCVVEKLKDIHFNFCDYICEKELQNAKAQEQIRHLN